MNTKTPTANRSRNAPSPLRLGFVPLTDCAPLVAAQELGLFRKYGLRVTLSRELGWASIRDKILHQELDAAHALAAMPMAATLGLGSPACECPTALVLNLHGNAITLSRALWGAGVRDGASLGMEIRRHRRHRSYTFGVVFPFSSHRHFLRRWLTSHGVDADRDVRVAVVPPAQMVANLKAGHLDGFCVGEPWNAVAAASGAGWCAAASAEFEPGHPEKVLMVRADFALRRPAEHLALVAALIDACEYCDQPRNHESLVEWLSRPEYVGATPATLRQGISGRMEVGYGAARLVPDFCVFYRHGANEPTTEKAAWVLGLVRASGLQTDPACTTPGFLHRVFRPDLYDQALQLRSSTVPTETNENGLSDHILVN